jgi:sugar diacid utilization regulator
VLTAVRVRERAQTHLYRPVVVSWRRGARSTSLLPDVAALVRGQGRANAAVACGDRALALVLADASPDGAAPEVRRLVQCVVDFVGARGGAPRAIIAHDDVPADAVAAQTRKLLGLARYAEARPVAGAVVPEDALELAGLLEGIDRARATDFVERHVGALLAYDRAHRTDLARVLEIGLDMPNRDEAARAAYMHRNTFRRHFPHALDLAGLEVEDGDQRLAVHVALRLAHVIGQGHGPRDG